VARLYPTGRRNFVHLFPSDDLLGDALAQLARDRGRRRVFALQDDSTGYGDVIANMFVRSSRRLGLDVVGRATWRPSARSFRALAARVAAARPQAVLVSGLIGSNAGQVVRDLRARLPRTVDLLGPDGLAPPALLSHAAGPAARGTYLALGGIVPQRLPAAGQRFVARFRRTQPGTQIESFAVYAAQATEVLLDAIARSDRTRGSVIDQLFRTRVRGGLIGDFGFDRHGDVDPGLDTIVRVTGGAGSMNIASTEGGVVEQVARVAPDGVR
jgi:branched-chain amino acid transport system substrate-binding protein